jgi:heptosyltransferase III
VMRQYDSLQGGDQRLPALTPWNNWETIPSMRFLLSRTDALGDLVISLPIMERILSRQPEAEVHWLVQPSAASVLKGLTEVAGVHSRPQDADLEPLIARLAPDAVLNLSHRDGAVISAARRARVPFRVARSRGRQIWEATHVLWKGRYGTGRHESQNVLDFLKPWNWDGGVPRQPQLVLDEEERNQGLSQDQGPVLGLILRGSGAGAFPSQAWWQNTIPILLRAGWNPVILSPPDSSPLEPVDLRGLMARLASCRAVLGPSTGPLHMASALGVPVLCIMGLRIHHGPDRWAPLGSRVQVIQYPGPEADLSGGMDRLDPLSLLPHLERLK